MDRLDFEKIDQGFLAFAWENLSPKDRIKVLADSPKTVWIFGAGASHHYNLNARGVPVPLASSFFKAFHELPTSEGFHAHVGPLINFLAHYRGVKPHEASKWTENIEDFMTSIESELNYLREKKERQELSSDDKLKIFPYAAVFVNMNFIFANVLNEAQNGPSESCYKYLLNFCGPNDKFITFNWDTLLDRALSDTGGWGPNDGYGFSFASAIDGTWKHSVESSLIFETEWKLIKLHGSTNWLVPYTYVHLETLEYVPYVPQSDKIFLYWQTSLPFETYKNRWRGGYVQTCYCYYPPNLPTDAFSQKELVKGEGRAIVKLTPIGIFSPFEEKSGDGVPSSPLLITPVRQKKYDMYQSNIEILWKEFSNLLLNADKIVIIGYSFPPTDVRPLELFRNTLHSREGDICVEIVAPDANDIIYRIGNEHLSKAKNIVIHKIKFEDYIKALWEDSPNLMKKAAEKYGEIKEWLERIYLLGEASKELYRE